MIKLIKKEDRYLVYSDDKEVGYIDVKQNKISFFCKEEERGNHYISSAVYELVKDLHEKEKISLIGADVTCDNEMAIHILEHNGFSLIKEENDQRSYVHENLKSEEDEDLPHSLYLAGGCFWGMEKAFQQLNGITSTSCGYVNGNVQHPSYEDVIRKDTGFKEAVRITYDPLLLDLSTIMEAYFYCIDPTDEGGQGDDRGSQYTTGVYYKTEGKEELEAIFAEKKKQYPSFHTELGPLINFFKAEEYHQNYLNKHNNGYCHIGIGTFKAIRALNTK